MAQLDARWRLNRATVLQQSWSASNIREKQARQGVDVDPRRAMPNTTARRAAAYGVAASWETKRASVATVITAIFTAILSSFGMPSHHDVARQLLDIPLLPRATTAEELVAAVGIHAAYDQSLGPHVARFHQYLVENHLTTVAALSAIAQAANCWNFLMDQHPRLPRAVVLVIEVICTLLNGVQGNLIVRAGPGKSRLASSRTSL